MSITVLIDVAGVNSWSFYDQVIWSQEAWLSASSWSGSLPFFFLFGSLMMDVTTRPAIMRAEKHHLEMASGFSSATKGAKIDAPLAKALQRP